MTEFARIFVIPDVADVHRQFEERIAQARRMVFMEQRLRQDFGVRSLLADLNLAYRQFNEGLRTAAVKGSETAVKGMKQHLKDTLKRPETGATPSLMNVLTATPLASIRGYETGGVGVASTKELDRAVNWLTSSKPYWRALEWGTGENGVPSQVGRILFGAFTGKGGGDATAPMAQFSGGGPHPIFTPKRSSAFPGGAPYGFGTIAHEIQGKHFIRYGADEAAILWRKEISDVQARAIRTLSQMKLAIP